MSNLVTNIQGYSIHDGPGIRTVVFLKGCGLECQWCSNPECISSQPEVGFIKVLCTKCGKCAGVCPEEALTCEAGQLPRIDRERCLGCGACSSVCDYKAIVLYGKSMSAGEVFDAVNRDKMFYDASGGGVTVSGGEPLLQPQFVCDLFEKCRRAGIHTCLEPVRICRSHSHNAWSVRGICGRGYGWGQSYGRTGWYYDVGYDCLQLS